MKPGLLAILLWMPTLGFADDGAAKKGEPALIRLAKGDQKAIALVVQQGEALLRGLVEIMYPREAGRWVRKLSNVSKRRCAIATA